MAKSMLFTAYRYSFGFHRFLWTSVTCYSNHTIRKTAELRNDRYIKKAVDVLNGSKNQKQKKWSFPLANSSELGSSFSPRFKTYNPRRARQLSVVFHEHITSLVMSGEVCPELLNYGFEIVKVQMQPDLTTVAVHWLTSGDNKDDLISDLLPKCASALRSKLTGLRIMGHVPQIQFCQDRASARVRKVEELLKIADMGPDHETADENEDAETHQISIKAYNRETLNEEMQHLGQYFSQEREYKSVDDRLELVSDVDRSVLNRELLKENKTENLQAKKQTQSTNQISADDNLLMPSLRSDLYGVQHNELMQKVLIAKRKLRGQFSQLEQEKADTKDRFIIELKEKTTAHVAAKPSGNTTDHCPLVKDKHRSRDNCHNANHVLSLVNHNTDSDSMQECRYDDRDVDDYHDDNFDEDDKNSKS